MSDPSTRPEAPGPAEAGDGWELLNDVPLTVTVEVGRTALKVRDLVGLEAGSLVPLPKRSGDPLEVSLDGRVFGRAEALVRGDRLSARLTGIAGGGR